VSLGSAQSSPLTAHSSGTSYYAPAGRFTGTTPNPKGPTMSAVAELGDKLAKLTIAEAVELKNYLKEKYQIEPAAGGVMMAGPAAGGGGAAAAPAAEPTEFNVIL
jgi:hypothetical protein